MTRENGIRLHRLQRQLGRQGNSASGSTQLWKSLRRVGSSPSRQLALFPGPVRFLSSNPVQSQSRNLVIPGRVYVITRKKKTVFTGRGHVISKHSDCNIAIAKRARPLRFTIHIYVCVCVESYPRYTLFPPLYPSVCVQFERRFDRHIDRCTRGERLCRRT